LFLYPSNTRPAKKTCFFLRDRGIYLGQGVGSFLPALKTSREQNF